MSSRAAGKKALITGAAQGLGAATAWMLARHGARVFLTDVNGDKVVTVAEAIDAEVGAGTAFAFEQDVRDEAHWVEVIDAATNAMDGLSVLVNNAGIVAMGSVEQLSLDDWRNSTAVNLDGVFLGTKYALPAMRDSQPGSIVNISSISALIAAHNLASYNATKAAVWMLSKSVALHCARQGWDIRCNSVHPAFIRTPILDGITADGGEAAILEKLRKQVPLGRLGEPDDVAHAVLYLASDESRFLTGAELKLDGGISAM